MGVIGGFEDNRGNIVDAYLWRKKYYRPIDLAECERQAIESNWKELPFKAILRMVLEPPNDTWPDSLLEFYHHGCGEFSCIDMKTDRIFVGGNPLLWYEANSLKSGSSVGSAMISTRMCPQDRKAIPIFPPGQVHDQSDAAFSFTG